MPPGLPHGPAEGYPMTQGLVAGPCGVGRALWSWQRRNWPVLCGLPFLPPQLPFGQISEPGEGWSKAGLKVRSTRTRLSGHPPRLVPSDFFEQVPVGTQVSCLGG